MDLVIQIQENVSVKEPSKVRPVANLTSAMITTVVGMVRAMTRPALALVKSAFQEISVRLKICVVKKLVPTTELATLLTGYVSVMIAMKAPIVKI